MSEGQKFGVICVDDPWQYSQYRDSANGAACSAYDTQSAADIAVIPVGDWAAKDCVLCMWATLPKLDQAIDLGRSRGFEYKAAIPWLKTEPSSGDLATTMGIWAMGCCELVTFWVRGTVGGFYKVTPGIIENDLFGGTARVGRKPVRVREQVFGVLAGDGPVMDAAFWRGPRDQWPILYSPKDRRHSRKPGTLQDYLESFPGPHLELFATQERENWTCWGSDLGYELGPWGVRPVEAE